MEVEVEKTKELLERVEGDLRMAYYLEASRVEKEEDNDPSATRMITMLKTVRGILRNRLKELEKEGKSESAS